MLNSQCLLSLIDISFQIPINRKVLLQAKKCERKITWLILIESSGTGHKQKPNTYSLSPCKNYMLTQVCCRQKKLDSHFSDTHY